MTGLNLWSTTGAQSIWVKMAQAKAQGNEVQTLVQNLVQVLAQRKRDVKKLKLNSASARNLVQVRLAFKSHELDFKSHELDFKSREHDMNKQSMSCAVISGRMHTGFGVT